MKVLATHLPFYKILSLKDNLSKEYTEEKAILLKNPTFLIGADKTIPNSDYVWKIKFPIPAKKKFRRQFGNLKIFSTFRKKSRRLLSKNLKKAKKRKT